MEARGFWEKIESISKCGLFTALLGVVTWFGTAYLETQKTAIEQQKSVLEQQKLDQEVLKEAMKVIFAGVENLPADAPLEARRLYRAHWIKTYNAYAEKYKGIDISDDLVAAVMEQGAWPTAIKGGSDNSNPTTVSTSDNDGRRGWVAVGLFRTERHQDLNFDVIAPNDGQALEKGMIILARWSAPIRINPFVSSEIGRLEGGECGKVLDFNNRVRGQAWAQIQVVQCPSEGTVNRVAQAQ